MIPYRYGDLDKRIEYKEGKKKIRKHFRFHLGQLKLLMSEIMFLTKVSSPGDLVVYAGAAAGYHIMKLAMMFPELHFELWDPRRYDMPDDIKPDNIELNRGYFTVDTAESYADKNVLFISDIRDIEGMQEVKRSKNETEQLESDYIIISDDMKMQMEWVQVMRPKYAFLKFRLPYQSGKTQYFGGKIYLQTYSPIATEARLMTNNYDDLIDYTNEEYDERLAYFNSHIRFEPHDDRRWDDIMERNRLKKYWDNYIALYIVAYYLEKRNGAEPTDDEVYDLFVEIVDFHRQRYGNKYNYLWKKKR